MIHYEQKRNHACKNECRFDDKDDNTVLQHYYYYYDYEGGDDAHDIS